MAYIAGVQSNAAPPTQRSGLAQICTESAQSTAMIENRTVILMAALDSDALSWRPLLQGMGLTVFNGFHHEGMGDHPVILVSEALWRQSDWPRHARVIRRRFPGGVVCVLTASVRRGVYPHPQQADLWDDARAMLLVAGVEFFTLEEPENAANF